jgi:hypothetical protein
MTIKLRPGAFVLAFLTLLLTSVPARADVILSFSFSALNITENPQLFTFSFSLPFMDGPYDTLVSEFSSTVTDEDDSGAAGVAPEAAFMMMPSIDGTDVLGAALGGGCTPIGAPGFSVPCDPFSTVSVGVATLASGVLGATVSFFLSGGDSISGAGRVTLKNDTVVPEPATLVLLGLGAGAVAVRRRRSRSA